MFEFVDIYCERLGPGLWAEPINALTNAAFFIAAFFAYKLAQQNKKLDSSVIILIALIAVIGAGSSAFHIFATVWAKLADSLPILLYQIAFLWLYARRIIGLTNGKSALLLALFFAAIVGFAQFPYAWLNGSLGYAPALLFVLGLGVWHQKNARREPWGLLLAGLVFIVSLAARSLDMAVCTTFPLGVHFLWHVLNGFVLYLTARAYTLNR
jgi:hypothetical protein